MEFFGYRNLVAYIKASEVRRRVYRLIRKFPKEEQFALCSQMRRAAVSIPSNIAEGQGRDTMKEFNRFLSVARGSLRELSTQLEICERVHYMDQSQTSKASSLIEEIDKMLNALSKSLIPF